MGLPYMVGGKTHPRFLYEKVLSKPEPIFSSEKRPLDYADEDVQFYARWLERESPEWKRDEERLSRRFVVQKEIKSLDHQLSDSLNVRSQDPYKSSLDAIREFHQLLGPQTLRACLLYTPEKITVQILWNKTVVKDEFIHRADELADMLNVYFSEYAGRVEEVHYAGLPSGRDLDAVNAFLRDLCPSWAESRKTILDKKAQRENTLKSLAQLKAELSKKKTVQRPNTTHVISDKVKKRLECIREFGEEPLY